MIPGKALAAITVAVALFAWAGAAGADRGHSAGFHGGDHFARRLHRGYHGPYHVYPRRHRNYGYYAYPRYYGYYRPRSYWGPGYVYYGFWYNVPAPWPRCIYRYGYLYCR
ncbi:MAG: hypothetical protein WB783_15120 [Arenicellales bacterium]